MPSQQATAGRRAALSKTRSEKSSPTRFLKQAAQDNLISYIRDGETIASALVKVGRTRKTYEQWRAENGSDFKVRVEQAKALNVNNDRNRVKGGKMPFAEFRKRYLKTETFWHQHQWIDILERREPRDLHPAQTYKVGRPSRILINTPPFHCPTLDTPILTTEGWRTVGDVKEGMFLYDPNGVPALVAETWQPDEPVDVFEVEFGTGDIIKTDAEHRWVVRRSPNHPPVLKTTREIMDDLRAPAGQIKWRVEVAQPDSMGTDPMGEPLPELPLDPYILGYWLGDGSTGAASIAAGEQDFHDLVAQVELAGFDYSFHTQRGGYSVYLKGLRAKLRAAGVFTDKHIPDLYATASRKDRLALLQGLMDSDGTITPKDGRVKFVQIPKRETLARGVHRLAASLGYIPRTRLEHSVGISPSTGRRYDNTLICVYFKPDEEPVFRLMRKFKSQRTTGKNCRTNTRTIKDIRPAGKAMVRCLSTVGAGNMYLIGDSCIPNHNAKSITVTVDYVVYRLCMDPSFRVIIVSESQRLAKDFLFGIKQRLTHPDYLDLQLAYAPTGGWKQTAESWKEDRIVVGAADRDGAEKDPSVQAIGIGGQIYGSRADLVILDDAITGKNVREHEKQMDWIRREVASRIEQGGKLLAIGTRIAPTDLYSELMNPENYGNSIVPWTYMASPAILEEGATPEDHVTLWPWTDRPWQGEDSEDVCDCNQEICRKGVMVDDKRVFPRWDGIHLEIGPRAENSVAGWALVYQQKAMHEQMVFPEHAVQKATNNLRVPGILNPEAPGCPPGGMHNMYVIAGCDPSIKGYAGLCVIAFDRSTGKRHLLNAYNLKAPTPEQLKDEMKRITEHFGVQEWRVEKTGLLQFFTQDQALRHWFAERGVVFREHLTSGSTKWDPTYGVASCAELFGAYDKVRDAHGIDTGDWRQIAPPLIEIPRHMNAGVKALVHQLVTWTPQLDPRKTPCDQVMALWFAEVGCRELTIQRGARPTTARFARFSSRSNQKKRFQVNLAELRAGAEPMNGLLRGD